MFGLNRVLLKSGAPADPAAQRFRAMNNEWAHPVKARRMFCTAALRLDKCPESPAF